MTVSACPSTTGSPRRRSPPTYGRPTALDGTRRTCCRRYSHNCCQACTRTSSAVLWLLVHDIEPRWPLRGQGRFDDLADDLPVTACPAGSDLRKADRQQLIVELRP